MSQSHTQTVSSLRVLYGEPTAGKRIGSNRNDEECVPFHFAASINRTLDKIKLNRKRCNATDEQTTWNIILRHIHWWQLLLPPASFDSIKNYTSDASRQPSNAIIHFKRGTRLCVRQTRNAKMRRYSETHEMSFFLFFFFLFPSFGSHLALAISETILCCAKMVLLARTPWHAKHVQFSIAWRWIRKERIRKRKKKTSRKILRNSELQTMKKSATFVEYILYDYYRWCIE